MSEFIRENRYTVFKTSDLKTSGQRGIVHQASRVCPTRECVVIEHDWPEYDFVWLMLEHRMTGFPVPDFNAVKCAADVQAAQSELAALREELVNKNEEIGSLLGREALTENLLTAAEQRNAELVAILSEHEWADWEPYDSYNTRAGGSYCIECGNHKEVGHDDDCKIGAALKPTESGASEADHDVCAAFGGHTLVKSKEFFNDDN